MAHLSENRYSLKLEQISVHTINEMFETVKAFNDVCMIILPLNSKTDGYKNPLKNISSDIASVINKSGREATIITIGEIKDLVHI